MGAEGCRCGNACFRKYELGNAMSKNNVRRNPTMCEGILTSGTPGRALRVVARASANRKASDKAMFLTACNPA